MHEACGFDYRLTRSSEGTEKHMGRVCLRQKIRRTCFSSASWKKKGECGNIWPKKAASNDPRRLAKNISATDWHSCNKRVVKDLFLDSVSVHDHDSSRYCGQSDRKCYYDAMRKMNFIGPQRQRKTKDGIDQWIANNQKRCLFC